MRKLKLALAFASACALLVGCAAPRSVMDQGWTQKPANVKVVFTEPFIANPDDLQDDLPDYVNNFSDWYKAQLEANFASQTTGVQYTVEKISQDKVKFEAAAVNGVNIKVPKIEEMDSQADVYLVMNDIWIGRVESATTCTTGGFNAAGGIGMGTTCSQDKDFTGKGSFAYLDAKTGKRLGYGEIEAKSGYTFTVSQSDWLNVMTKTVSTMLENTPIKK